MSKKNKKTLVGKVTSDKMDKTVVITVETRYRHPLYHKFIHKRRKYKAHDEQNQYRTDDMVRIQEYRPVSKDKCWIVVEKLSH